MALSLVYYPHFREEETQSREIKNIVQALTSSKWQKQDLATPNTWSGKRQIIKDNMKWIMQKTFRMTSWSYSCLAGKQSEYWSVFDTNAQRGEMMACLRGPKRQHSREWAFSRLPPWCVDKSLWARSWQVTEQEWCYLYFTHSTVKTTLCSKAPRLSVQNQSFAHGICSMRGQEGTLKRTFRAAIHFIDKDTKAWRGFSGSAYTTSTMK